MIAFACMLLLAAATRVELVDEDFQIPAGEWRWIPVDLKKDVATVFASYSVPDGSDRVRIALVTQEVAREDRDRLDDSAFLTATSHGKNGGFAYRVRDPDGYAVLVDNSLDKRRPATVHMRVSLDFSHPRVTQISPQRQITVVAISFLAFVAVATYSARKLLKAVRG